MKSSANTATVATLKPKKSLSSIKHFFYSTAIRSAIFQFLIISVLVLLGIYLVGNVQTSLSQQGIKTGFGFLSLPAGFEFGQQLIAFQSTDSFLRAYYVAILNTLNVSFIAILLSTLLGTIVGLCKLSSNILLSKLASVYVELFRNTPQLVLLIFIYTLLLQLPPPREALNFLDIAYLSNRGFIVPWFLNDPATGFSLSFPILQGLNFQGGLHLTPEFLSILLALTLYISAFIAEIVRSGIMSVPRGQLDAAKAIGLSKAHTLRHVVLPQALRVMVPASTTQYVSILKNSSLGVAVGYPELFSVNNTIVTLSGQAVEAIAIMMSIYLMISLLISILMNFYNKMVQIKER